MLKKMGIAKTPLFQQIYVFPMKKSRTNLGCISKSLQSTAVPAWTVRFHFTVESITLKCNFLHFKIYLMCKIYLKIHSTSDEIMLLLIRIITALKYNRSNPCLAIASDSWQLQQYLKK